MTTTVATLQAVFTGDTSRFDTAANNVQTRLTTLGNNVQNFGNRMTGVGMNLAIVMAPMALAFGFSARAAIDFETAMAGVEKTVDATDLELQALEDQIKTMATSSDNPLSSLDNAHVALANIMEIAGQLGVAKDDLVPFTETMGLLAMTTNLTAEDAATMSARFANITQMDFTNVDRFGATIVELGNNSATTEAEILAMALRISAAGTSAGLNEQEILGMAAALSSVGVSAELGGGNLSRFINAITLAVSAGGPELDNLATKAGMTADEFKALYESNPAEAITALISAMGEMDQSGRIETLENLGLTGSETADVIGRLALNSALLGGSLEIAGNAWEENTALTEEAEKRAATTESAMNRMRNQVNGLGIEIGTALLPALNTLLDNLSPLITEFANFAAAHPGVITAVAGLTIALFALGTGMMVLGPIVTALGGLIAFGGTALSVGMTAAGVATGAFTTALALLTSPITITIGLGIALGIAFFALKDKLLDVAGAIGGAVLGAFNDLMGTINDVVGGIEDAFEGAQRFLGIGGDMRSGQWEEGGGGTSGGGRAEWGHGGSGAGGSRSFGGFASGTSWTGWGGVNDVAGLVHAREAVVPAGGMMVVPSPRGLMLEGSMAGGGRGSTVVIQQLDVHGVENVQELFDQLQRVAKQRA